MKASRFSEAQKAFILKQGADGMPVADICRKAGISQATYFNWKKRYDGLLPSSRSKLGNAVCSKIYSEKASGGRSDRTELRNLLKSLQPCAVVVVTRLDRLARSTIDLLTTIKQIAETGCLFKSLAEPWADTTTPAGRLMLTVLGGLAEFERELIKIRTSEGRERAQRAGIKMGRKPI